MCSTPKMPETPAPVQTPTMADAKVTKAGSEARNRSAAMSQQNIKSSSRGVLEDANAQKKKLLGE